jgi:hypothetical protein
MNLDSIRDFDLIQEKKEAILSQKPYVISQELVDQAVESVRSRTPKSAEKAKQAERCYSGWKPTYDRIK